MMKRRSVDGAGKPKSTLATIQAMEKQRAERRERMEERKVSRPRVTI